MNEPLEDVWYARDLPVLRESVRLIDSGTDRVLCDEVGRAVGFDEITTQLAFSALRRRGLVKTLGAAQKDHLFVMDVAGEAYVLTGAHPSGETALRELLRELADAERDAAPEEKGKLARARAALADISYGVIVDVMAGVIRGQIPM